MSLDPTTYTGHNLVFIIGCPRSGTTWLQRLLAAHPKVRTGQESDLFDIYIGPQLAAWRRELNAASSGRGGVGLACYFDDTQFMTALKRFTVDLLEPMAGNLAPGDVFVEKTPSHALYIDTIIELLPDSRFVHVLRDARDTVASLTAASRGWGSGWAPRRARSAAKMWVQHVQAARAAATRLPRRQFLEVRYEGLLADTPRALADVVGWLELSWSNEDLANAVHANRPEAARQGGGTPIPLGGAFGAPGSVVRDPPGFVRRAGSGGWRTDLSRIDQMQVWLTARSTMQQVGYPWSRPW